MKKKLIISLSVVLVFGLQNVFAQFPIKIPKLPKIEKPKSEQAKNEDEGNSSNENNNRNSSTGGSAQKDILQVNPSSVGKMYFSNKPFGATNDGGKTSFTTNDYIYGRFETNGGKTLREAFGFAPATKENHVQKLIFNLYVYDPNTPSSDEPNEYQRVVNAIINSPKVVLTEADLDKTYWNFDVLPEPASATTRILFANENFEDDVSGALALYKFLKDRAKEQKYIVEIELVKKTADFRGNPEPEEKWLTVNGRLSLDFKGADYTKIKADQEKMEANRLARLKKADEDRDNAKVESEPLPKEWTLKSNPLLPGLTESNLRALFQTYGAESSVTKQIIKFYAAPYASTERKVVTNELGIPKYRVLDQWFTIFAKANFNDGEQRCFYQNFFAAQNYAGAGTYGNLILVTQRAVDISCAKMGLK